MEPRLFRYRTDRGAFAVMIVKEGRKFLHGVGIDKTVKVVAVPRELSDRLSPVEYKNKPYPVRRACRRFLEAGRSLGISKGAKALIVSLKNPEPQLTPAP